MMLFEPDLHISSRKKIDKQKCSGKEQRSEERVPKISIGKQEIAYYSGSRQKISYIHMKLVFLDIIDEEKD